MVIEGEVSFYEVSAQDVQNRHLVFFFHFGEVVYVDESLPTTTLLSAYAATHLRE